ncbi:MAG: ribulose-phosphate 3-epimerase [Alphaproteobacteria bacterium]|nr:ribulose-phosphate 3-epimerase [Alphaproteobacteria bacterium]
MSQEIEIAPSILSADFTRLADEIKALENAGADLIHVDIMDGHFVPNMTFGPGLVAALRPITTLPLDVHLMIMPADPFIEAFAHAGADILTIHPESGPHVYRTLQKIKDLGKKAGIALNPGTPADVVDPLLELVDQILVMTVNPGFGGQTFIETQLNKIERIRQKIITSQRSIVLEVDGGITSTTAVHAINAGATRLVAGTSVFMGGSADYKKNIEALRLSKT